MQIPGRAPDPGVPLTRGNARVKDACKLARRATRTAEGRFLADGPKAVAAALQRPGCVVEVFATVAATQQYAELAATAERWTPVDDRAMAALSDSVTPAGLVAVCRVLDEPLDRVLATRDGDPVRLVVICAEVSDPGNAGTIIRTADAAGADAVVLAGASVDAYNAKTVRATVGSLFHVPLAISPDIAAAVAAARAAGLQVLAADGAGEVDIEAAGDLLARPTAWLLGNEAHGLAPEVAVLADHRVRIPIHGRAESLNLSTAAALCLYASARSQRAG